MSLTPYVDKVREVLDTEHAGEVPSPALFKTFAQRAVRQVRRKYTAHNTPEEFVAQVANAWRAVFAEPAGAPRVVGSNGGNTCQISTHMPDQPFIVDTIRLALARQNAEIVRSINLVLAIGRNAEGEVIRVGDHDDRLESVTTFTVEGLPANALSDVVDDVLSSLRLSQSMVRDFQLMTEAVDAAAYRFNRHADRTPDQADRLMEASAFLRWLLADNFVFMGAITSEDRLGFASEGVGAEWAQATLEDWTDEDCDQAISVRKGANESPVHRTGRVDEIRVALPTPDGGKARCIYLQGLFTYRAVTQPSRHVPQLRRILADLLRNQESSPGSYRYKGIANVFDSLPTEYLFTATEPEIADMVERVLESEQEGEVRTHILQRHDGGSTFVLAALPRQQWSDRLRASVEEALIRTSGATYCDHGVFVGRYQTMLVHWYMTGTEPLAQQAKDELSAVVRELSTPWHSQVHDVLEQHYTHEKAAELVLKYRHAFEAAYTGACPPDRIAKDIEILELLPHGPGVEVDMYLDHKGRVNLRLFQSQDILLSDILPVLDHFGLVIIDQYADAVRPSGGPDRDIDTFRLKGVDGVSNEDLLRRTTLLRDGLRAVFHGHMTDDALNRLLLRANIPWKAVDLVRGLFGYARQLGLKYTLSRFQEVVLGRPDVVAALWGWFSARFDPDLSGSREDAEAAARGQLDDLIMGITQADQDLVFGTLANLVDSTLRTNFFRQDRAEHYISFKIECAKVKQMPEPRMMYEIYVHHRAMEGVHLRGGSVARGGIRWSDREDFRREILDLVSTQMVKNVLIVPEGAKGGFFIKHAIHDRAARRRRADELYQILIRGLLDVTDNIIDGKVLRPNRVVARDGNDPYLVVAADKGTAHLSDTANRLSAAYGFWLDDAFASGGSNGYDHKVVGITARGGWMTARRHFLEMGVDTTTDAFTCVGVGDPAGDVFGNGVVEHDTMKLVAAFNHLHIFIDPDPDPATSYAERKRLFEAAKGWDHYDTSKLSEGGGIFSRQAKSVPLTPQIKARLGVLQDELPPDTVIRILLRLDVDLLWNGGIGTYVKASHQTNADAGDPSNDDVRVNANELRCKVLGEGGNLGFTQAGRVEFAQLGGRINTDAIDNSGGVDMSDHEVNLKILLNPMVASGRMTRDERNTLLEALTDDVTVDVLANNDRHGRQLSIDEARGKSDPMAFSQAIDWVCQRGKVSRAALGLPTDADLTRRARASQGMTRPELAVLQAHVKMHVFKELTQTDHSVIPRFSDLVRDYFPKYIGQHFAEDVAGHMLYRSIGMTVVTNDTIADSGAKLFPLVMELTGAGAGQVAHAWINAMELAGADKLRKSFGRSDVPLEGQYAAWEQLTQAATSLVLQWLSAPDAMPDADTREEIRALLQRIARTRGIQHEARIRHRSDALIALKVPKTIAAGVALAGELPTASEIQRIRSPDARPTADICRYMALGETSRLLPAARGLETRRVTGGWDGVAIAILRTRYLDALRELCGSVRLGAELRLGVDRVATRLGLNQLRELQALMDHILGEHPDISSLLVAETRVRAWIAQQRTTA